jgi:hypothetical protein
LNKKTAFSVDPVFKFDWYQATLPQDTPIHMLYSFFENLGQGEIAPTMHGYEFCFKFGDSARLLYGGATGYWGPHIIIHGGDACYDIVEFFREMSPVHRPSRVDCKIDFCFPGAFAALAKICKSAAKKFGVQSRLYGDWIDGIRGRTLYLGGTKSTHKMRLYEKGHELRQKGIQPDASLDWVRLEFQIAPAKQVRSLAASMSASELARSSRWTSFICTQIGSKLGQGISMCTQRTTPKLLSSLEHMLTQYSSVIHYAVKEEILTRSNLQDAVNECIDFGTFGGFHADIHRKCRALSPEETE